ncbi:L-fucose-proton symporter [Madurella mycetomatis]|uniref:L-fucose-proton symporter n=1 Tax=Madurella mycetomatis TaxID=100816 RepID=A0A175VY34_9PEZI|nr:L-fucose-proton symporter [Madurella mycetomatis]
MSSLGPQDVGFPDRGPAVFAVTTATLALSSLFVAARMVSRMGILRRTGWDDYIILLAWLLAVFLSLAIDFGTKRGLGRHDENIEPGSRAGLRMCEYVFSILYNPALMATKTSILIFYLRLAKNTQKILRLASWAVLGIVNVAGTILTFMNIFQCKPISAAWDINVAPIQCIPLLTEFICSAPVNVTTDLAILALPIPVLTSMRLPPKQKTILVMTFALGIFVTIVDVVRIYYLQQAIEYTPVGASSDRMAMFGQSSEFAWNASLSLMWSAVEVNVGIICSCIPTLKPLIIRILPAMLIDPDGTCRSSTHYTSDRTKPSATDDSQAATNPAATTELPALHVTPPDGRMSEEISIRHFLSGAPASRPSTDPSTRQTPSLLVTGHRDSTSVYFGFVNMKRPKSMLKTSALESFKYCTVVSILFFLWGFSYGLLNTLNNVVADVTDMSAAQTLGLTSIYFGGGYFFGPLLDGGGVPSVGGFKATFITGLLIYGIGTIMFWPSAVLAAYGGFVVSSFVVGFGLAVLETAANPFIALCGPPEYADARLLLAQAVQAVASVLSGLLATNVFFVHLDRSDTSTSPVGSTTLIDVQWTYLAVTLLSVLLALFFYYMPLPEVSDADLVALASTLPVNPKQKLPAAGGKVSLRTWAILLAVLSQWTYVAAQENMSLFFSQLLTSFATPSRPLSLSIPSYLLISHAAFAVSRFLAALLAYLSTAFRRSNSSLSAYVPAPRTLLLLSISLSTLCVLLVVVLPLGDGSADPDLAVIPVILFFFCEGPIWPLVFSLGLRGQGARTKRAAAWLTMGASGPGGWPFVGYAIIKDGGRVQVSFVVVVALMAVAGGYPVFLAVVRAARGLVDPVVGNAAGGAGDVEMASGGNGGAIATTGAGVGASAKHRKKNGEGMLSGSGSKGGQSEGRSSQGEPVRVQAHREPWENQELDTSILQD